MNSRSKSKRWRFIQESAAHGMLPAATIMAMSKTSFFMEQGLSCLDGGWRWVSIVFPKGTFPIPFIFPA
jgi:acyl dehydratase